MTDHTKYPETNLAHLLRNAADDLDREAANAREARRWASGEAAPPASIVWREVVDSCVVSFELRRTAIGVAVVVDGRPIGLVLSHDELSELRDWAAAHLLGSQP